MAIDHVLPQSLDDLYGPGAEHADDEASIDKFLAEYDADSDIWWTLETGEMQNRFEQLMDLHAEGVQLLQNLVDGISAHSEGLSTSVRMYVDSNCMTKAQKWLFLR